MTQLAEVVNLTSVMTISTDGDHICILLPDGTARCWGTTSKGQLGAGTMNNESGPKAVLRCP